ncbi:hypothetical protein D9M71_661380 [compost metagenome]
MQRLLAFLEGMLQLGLFGLAGLPQAAVAAEHAGGQIAMLLGQSDQLQQRLHRHNTLQFTLGLAAAFQRAYQVQSGWHQDQGEGQSTEQDELGGEG